MTLAVDDDFGGFVAARWPDLEAVALVAAPDPAAARELTTRALAAVGGRWDEVLDEGAPTRAAQAALLRDIARSARPRRLPGPADRGPGPADGPSPRPDGSSPWTAEDDDVVGRELLATLAGEPPLVRARLAAGVLWECDDAETADLAGVGTAPAEADLAAARGRLLAAHRRALATEGLSPADWRVDRDLADALGSLSAGRPDPPDPAGLVSGRARTVRRRSLLTGGAAVAAAGAATWWVLRGLATATPEDGSTAPTSGPVDPQDPTWSSTDQWPARGSLAGDAGIQTLVLGGRLLYAEDVGGTRVVVATVLDRPNSSGTSTVLTAWTGATAVPAARLTRADLWLDRIDGADDVVALTVPTAPGGDLYTTGSVGIGSRSQPAGPDVVDTAAVPAAAVLVILARPTEQGATWSDLVHPTANGSVERAWTLVPLDEGVGLRVLDRQPGSAARVRVGGYDGPLPGVRPPLAATDGLPPLEAASHSVADATGMHVGSLTSEVVVDSPVDPGVLDAFGMAPTGSGTRIRVVDTTTPDGALMRSLHVSDDGRPGNSTLFGSPVVLAVDRRDEPVVRRLDLVPPRTTRYVVVAPGAASCQLLATSPAGYPVSKVVPMKGDSALVPIVNGQDTGRYRLVLWDERGRRTYSAVPDRGRTLLDLRAEY